VLIPSIISIAIGVIFFIAAVAIAIPTLISRHSYRSFVGTSTAHQVLRDSHASWLVDRALRALAQSCTLEWRRVPGIVTATLDTEAVTVYLAAPSPQPPLPWETSSNGLIWRARLADLQVTPVEPTTPNPYPGLFTIGVSDAGRVFADLDQAHGLISIGGDEASRREVARRWIEEASGRPWATGIVLLVGLDASGKKSDAPGTTLNDAITFVESGAPGLVVVEGEPRPEQTARLLRALEAVDSRCPVVVVGESTDARWRFTAQQNGWITSDFLPSARFTPAAAVLAPVDTTLSATVSA